MKKNINAIYVVILYVHFFYGFLIIVQVKLSFIIFEYPGFIFDC